jgi:hypothetical protein
MSEHTDLFQKKTSKIVSAQNGINFIKMLGFIRSGKLVKRPQRPLSKTLFYVRRPDLEL